MSSPPPFIDLVMSDEDDNDSDIEVLWDSGIVTEGDEGDGDGEERDQEAEAPVIVEDGPLTLTPLVSLVKSTIKKRQRDENVVDVDDSDDDSQGKKERVLTGVRWTGESVKIEDGRTYYDEVTLKLGQCAQKVVPGQYLLITPDQEEPQSATDYPCRVLSLYTMTSEGRLRNMAHVQLFTRGENTFLGRSSDPRSRSARTSSLRMSLRLWTSCFFQSKIWISGESREGPELPS